MGDPDPTKVTTAAVEKLEILPKNPQAFFDDFVARMNHEGHPFTVEAESGVSSGDSRVFRFNGTADKKPLGSIGVNYNLETRSLKIDYVGGRDRSDPKEDWKPDGIGSALFAYALTQYPETEQMEGQLRSDNLRAFKAGVERGLSEEDALKETPAYKIRAKFGYSVIDMSRWEYPKDVKTGPAKWETIGKGELITTKRADSNLGQREAA